MRPLRIVTLMLAALMLAAPLWSQTGMATVRGTVTDPQGRVIRGATVTLTNVGTNAVLSRQSTDDGVFTFEFIPPGEYSLEVAAKRFGKKTLDNVRALVGKE